MVKLKKVIVKNSLEKLIIPERPRRSLRKNDEDVIDYTCKDACVKVANEKLVSKEMFGGGGGGGALKCPK